MKYLYSFCNGLMLTGIYCFVTQLFSPGADPELIILFMALSFVVGCIFGWIDAGRKQRKKEEDEERQAEQDRTNELMREYLEKKLREENDNK